MLVYIQGFEWNTLCSILHGFLLKGNHIITWNTSFWEIKKTECRQHAFPDYNVRALFPNAFLRVFLIGLERKVRRSDPANQNKKVKAEEGAKQAFWMLVTMCPSIDHLAERHPPSTRLWQPQCRWSSKAPTLWHCHHGNYQHAVQFFGKLMPQLCKIVTFLKGTHMWEQHMTSKSDSYHNSA